MASLFIDSTYDITLGILNEELGWLRFQRYLGQKASSIIQVETHSLLKSVGLSMKDISQVLTISGPGFYTGLRLSEGFADVMVFHGASHFNFLSYDIPKFSGVPSGTWMTKAYRGEYFFHNWDGEVSKNVLIATKDLEEYLASVDKTNLYIHSESAIDEVCRKFLGKYNTTTSLLESSPLAVLTEVCTQKTKMDSFYFRAPEDEFKVSL